MVVAVVSYRRAASRTLGSSSPGLSAPDSMSLAMALLSWRYLAMPGLYRRHAVRRCTVICARVARLRAAGALLGSAPFCTSAEEAGVRRRLGKRGLAVATGLFLA